MGQGPDHHGIRRECRVDPGNFTPEPLTEPDLNPPGVPVFRLFSGPGFGRAACW
jgi:hypothetical protein